MVLPTPEGVELRLVLAGVGTRLGAAFLDLCLRAALFLAVVLVYLATGESGWGEAVVAVAGFLFLFAYDVVFEVWGGGRTPGKRRFGIRVVRTSGRAVDLRASVVRNLLRIVDEGLTLYLGGTVLILATRRNQRLGDLAAGTLVVRDPQPSGLEPARVARGLTGPAWADGRLDVSAVSRDELVAVREFLARRHGLAPEARRRLAGRLAAGLGPRVGGLPDGTAPGPEELLEAVAAAKGTRE